MGPARRRPIKTLPVSPDGGTTGPSRGVRAHTATHPALAGGEERQARLLRTAALFRFLNFTHKLELLVVNTVTANIALGRYDVALEPATRRHAHRIYVDEGYHALFSFDHMVALQAVLPRQMAAERKPQFLVTLDGRRHRLDQRNVLLLELLFVIFSEMLITGTLKTAHARADLDEGVQDLLTQHSQDETRHHVFYKALLQDIWPQLSRDDQDFVIRRVPSLLLCYCSPDVAAMEAELACVGLSSGTARQILAETYPRRSTARYAQQIGQDIFNALTALVSDRQRNMLDEAAGEHMMDPPPAVGVEQLHV